MRKIGAVLLLLILLLPLSTPVLAQVNSSIVYTTPDLSTFPQVIVLFRAYDEEGSFVKNLTQADVKAVESQRILTADSLELQEPGTHFVVAVNEGPTLGNRYAGVQRIENIRKQISAWAESLSTPSVNDFSLVTNDGAVQTRLTDPQQWINAITDYQPDLTKAVPGLASLSTAIDLASDPSADPNKTRAVLYITPLPTDDQLQGVQDAAKRAEGLNVHLFIWLIGPQNYSGTNGALVLQTAADDTGGKFFVYSGAETLPDIASYLDPLQYIYKLVYTSAIKASGKYDFSLQIRSKSLSLDSKPTQITIEVLPPNPILLSPPIEITRDWTKTDKPKDSVLAPNTVPISILIEFPDKHPRALHYTRFFVDDKLVQENASAPFDQFTWDISGITTSGTYKLQATIEDVLGLTNQTIEIPVTVTVLPKPQNLMQKLFGWITPLYAGLLGGIILVLLVFGGFYLRYRKGRTAVKRETRRRMTDPVTQPVAIEGDILLPTEPVARASEWPSMKGGEPVPARLLPLTGEDLVPLPGSGYALVKTETTLGSNGKKADLAISGSTVSELHAVIKREGVDLFRIQDAGSAAGTWVNYAPISSLGTLLENGDLVHLGRTALRFELHQAGGRKIQVLPYQEE